MADNFQVPSTLPDGDPGVNIHALERTVNGATVKVGVSVTVDPTDPTKRQAVDSTYGAAIDVKRLPGTVAADIAELSATLQSIESDIAMIKAKTDNLDVALSTRTKPADAQTVTGTVAVSGVATAENQATEIAGLASIDGHVYGLEASAASIDAKLPSLSGGKVPVTGPLTDAEMRATPVAVSVSDVATAALQGAVDETAPASDTASSGQNGRLQRIAQRLSSLIALLPSALGQAASAGSLSVTMASDQTPIPVGASMTSASASFTRPADTTAYGIGDVVCNSTSSPTVMTFSSVARANGGSGRIVGASLVLGSNPTTKPTYDLMLFDTAPAIDNDNALFTPTDAEMLKCVARIPFAVPTVGDATGTGTNCVYFASVLEPYICDPAASALYGVLVARNAVTPSSADTYNVRLIVERN